MKYIKVSILLLAALGAAQANARTDDHMPLPTNYQSHRQTYDEIGVGLTEIFSLLSHPVVARNLWNGSLSTREPAYIPPPPPREVSLTDYQPELPHKTQLTMSRFEKIVLTAYLDNPADIRLAKFLALYHLNSARHEDRTDKGSALEHSIVATYFLSRAKDLGARDPWVRRALHKTETKLATLAAKVPGVTLEETHAAHAQVHEAFFNREENRYKAQAALLDDYVAAPNNVYTALLSSTVNLWIGSEAGFDDPSVLYNFVLGSYFSIQAIDLAERAEQAWRSDPAGHKRFRLGSTLGGFSVPLRRWLSKLHKDVAATQALDREHEEWRQVNIAFHMLPIAWTLFEENLPGAREAFDDGFLLGLERPELVSVQNRARFTFNFMGTFMIGAEMALKEGDVGAARGMWLGTMPFLPNFADWDLGEEGRNHLLANAEAIAALYQNDNPKDDPLPFQLRKRKWGSNTITCQSCHQVQWKVWSEEEKNNILIPPDDILTVETWPDVSTTWYGAKK